MASSTDTKLYVALAVLAVLGGALYVQQKKAKEEASAHSYEAASKVLPKLTLTEEQSKKVNKIVIDKPATEGDKAEPAETHVLEKDGETWNLTAPVKARANQKNVENLLKNLTQIDVKEQVSPDNASFENYDLTDEKALQVRLFEGDSVVFQFWAGSSGGRGQTARLPGQDGVYAIDGFSSFMAKRDTKGWRDLKIAEIATDTVKGVTIEGEEGTFVFEKTEDQWAGKFKKGKSPVGLAIKDFEPSKVDDMLRAYKTLNATGFGDGKTAEETGLTEPVATVTFAGESETKILFGSNSEGSSRWVKLDGKDEIYSVSSWAADWAVAGQEKFQKKAEPAAPASDE